MRSIKMVRHILLYSLAVLPLLSMAMVNIAILFFVIAGVWCYITKSKSLLNKKDILKSLFWLSLPFTMYLMGLFWSLDIKNGFSFVERSYVFFLFPLLIFCCQIYDSIKIKTFIQIYIIASSIFSCVVFLFITYKILIGKILIENSDYFSVVSLRAELDRIPIIHEHPIYLSLMLALALILLFYNRFKKKWLNVGIVLVIIPTLLLASSRGPLLALIIVFSCIIIQNNKNRLRALLLLFLFFISIVFVTFFSPLNSRIKEISTTKSFYPEGIHHNSFNIRNGIYKCAFEISKQVPIYGFGTGSVQGVLNSCYEKSFNTNVYEKKIYNTHNQYFHFYISFGLLGFIIIVYSFILFFKRALIINDNSYFYFLVFFLICFLTENIINRNTGIVLFSIFNSLFYYRTYLENDNS